jgi:glutamate dehydrogenase
MPNSTNLFPLSTVKDITAGLSPKLIETLKGISLANSSDDAGRVSSFLDRLFHRAPTDLPRKKGLAELRSILEGCLEAITMQSNADDGIGVSLKRAHNSCGLFIALGDHPFIISTLAERLYEAKISLVCYQHPILSVNGRKVALSFIDVDSESRGQIEGLIPTLRDSLRSLVNVVDDYAAMVAVSNGAASRNIGKINTEWGQLPENEARDFFNWLSSGSFYFVGASTWDQASQLPGALGAWKSKSEFQERLAAVISDDLQRAAKNNVDFSINKLLLKSPAHRHVPLLHVFIKATQAGNTWLSLVGYLTSKALACEALDIPVLRHKLEQVLATEETPPNSHDYKYVIEVIDNMPTDEALRLPVRDLQTIAQLALGVFSREDSRSITCIDTRTRWALTAIVMPPDRYSAATRSEVRSIVESSFGAAPSSSEIHLDSSKKRQLRLYISTPLSSADDQKNPDLDQLGKTIQRATLSWKELLDEQLKNNALLTNKWPINFPENYQASISVAEAVNDFYLCSKLTDESPVAVSLFQEPNSTRPPQLSFLSSGSSISISTAVPALEDLGLEVLDANSYSLSSEDKTLHILKCVVRPFDGKSLDPAGFNRSVSSGLAKIILGKALSDPLNILLRTGDLTIDQISLLRSYCALLWQTYKIATKRTMWKALAYSPEVSREFVKYFDTAFNPDLKLSLEERKARLTIIEQSYQIALRKVADITHDRILKALLVLLKNTLRTNFFNNPDTIAIKLHSEKVEFMPHPRPLYEMFVYSSRIEGTHLRSSKVARGGIRWSERLDDYRSEVLGLVKTQKVKNVIIVPSGAKGGFVVKATPAPGATMGSLVEASYKEYITALLSITDNTIDNKPVRPANSIIYDEFDPYFVVAADKGTATFSDLANSIAQERYSFWLGDAFASGGSQGYDHKKYGITARGGWECVMRHTRDLGIDTNAPFTAVGIGDMSGDVFGNAMILTSNLLLLGAFNHKHIFIDPAPNQDEAFKERQRLFSLSRSQWSDFDSKVISQGGGVFERYAKEITITPEMRQAFAIGDDVPAIVDGETMISLLLKAPVTVLWNGGIGTYVKARSESHSDVNDGANDAVRVNADELRCLVVGEGGNLGFTQRARVQCAQAGIKINTDAIDNSGGVDLSDHEVNLKLLFSPLVAKGALKIDDRNNLLKKIANDVVDSVLQHNRDQSLLLTVSEICSMNTIEQYRSLIREMHASGFLDRARDHLPDEQELGLRVASQRGMARPELAVCSAAVKMWLKEGLRDSGLLNDPELEKHLLEYFPKRVRDSFRTDVLGHPLRREIISNEIVGEATLAVGISFIPFIVSSSGAAIPHVMKCLLAADAILKTGELRQRVRDLDTAKTRADFIELWMDLTVALRRAGSWLIQTHGDQTPLKDILSLYLTSFSNLIPHARTMFAGDELTRFEKRLSEYRAKGASENDATVLSLLRRVHVVLEILWCAREYKQDVTKVAATLSEVLDTFQLHTIFKFEQGLNAANKWEQELADGSFQEIRRELSKITGEILTNTDTQRVSVAEKLLRLKECQAVRAIMAEVNDGIRLRRPFTISVLPLVAKHLRDARS